MWKVLITYKTNTTAQMREEWMSGTDGGGQRRTENSGVYPQKKRKEDKGIDD